MAAKTKDRIDPNKELIGQNSKDVTWKTESENSCIAVTYFATSHLTES